MKIENCYKPIAGVCELCGKELKAYDGKWVLDHEHMVCAEHYLWNTKVPPPPGYKHYTDG